METPENIQSTLSQCCGTQEYYKHGRWLRMTEGVAYLRTAAECCWLLDIVCSLKLLPECKTEQEFLSITLKVNKEHNSAVFVVTDGGKDGNEPKEIYRQYIEFTDFPLEEIHFFCCDWIIMLTNEY